MQTWIGLFRGINVGGKNVLPMVALVSALEALKLRQIRTYIQSGNVVFKSKHASAASLASTISRQLEQQHGFRPHVLLLSGGELLDAVSANPFPEAVSDPKTLHVFFLESTPPSPNVAAIEAAKTPTERYKLAKRLFYLHAPDGIGRSKLAMNVEKQLGVVTTARNYRTVAKLAEIVMES